MTHVNRLIPAAVAALLAVGAGATLAAQSPKLVGPVYPGAVPERADAAAHAAITWSVVYLSRDGLDAVTAFYDENLGATRSDEASRLPSDDPRHRWRVISLRDAFAMTGEPLNEAPATRAAVVTVEAVHPTHESGAVSAPNVLGQMFNDLRAVVRASGVDPAPYEAAIARNQDLARSYYPIVDRDAKGEPVRFDAQVYARCEREVRPSGVGDPGEMPEPRELSDEEREALAARIQQLYMQGKVDEAQKVMEQLAGGAIPTPAADPGMGGLEEMADQWVACIEELRPRAYTTRILIDTHPTTWDWRAARER